MAFPEKVEGKSLRFYGTSLDVENFLKGYTAKNACVVLTQIFE